MSTMQHRNTIEIRGNGIISINDKVNDKTSLDISMGERAKEQLQTLSPAVIDSLLQLSDVKTLDFTADFKDVLKEVAFEKNIVKGNISEVNEVNIGDKKIYNYIITTSEYQRYKEEVAIIRDNRERSTEEPIDDKFWKKLDPKVIAAFMQKERVIQDLELKEIATDDHIEKLIALGELTSGENKILKGTYFCLGTGNVIKELSNIAVPAKFFVYNDLDGEKTSVTQRLDGNLISQYESIHSLLIKNLQLIRNVQTSTDDYEIPGIVFRELIANALIHSDYSQRDPAINTKIELFPDRLVITNPGSLPPDVDPENPKTIISSETLNPCIAKAFFLYGVVETAGKGILRIQAELERHGFEKAAFERLNNYVRVTVIKKKAKESYNPVVAKELTLNIPKTHPEDIIGRDEDLQQLHDLLNNEQRVVVVNGLGGIGKTTLAQAYVSRYYNEYNHIAWITQSSENIANDFTNAAGLLESLGLSKTSSVDSDKLLKELILKLKSIVDKPNLLIIDNADRSLERIRDILPGPPIWHILVTSREEISGLYHKQLDFLNEEQAIMLFKKHYTLKKLNNSDISDIVKSVDYHTLTIEILAKTAQVQRYTLEQLRQTITNDLKVHIRVKHNKLEEAIEEIGTYLGKIFDLSKLNENEIWIMKQLACLPNEFHTYDLLRELIIDENGPFAVFFAETINNLSDKGWLLRNNETDSYKMHHIIAEVVERKHHISVVDVSYLLIMLTSKLQIDAAKDNPVDKFTWIPYGKVILDRIGKSESPQVSDLQNSLAVVLEEFGDYLGAKYFLERAIEFEENTFGEDHPRTTLRYSNLAAVLQEIGDYRGAKLLLEKAAKADEKNFGEGSPRTALRYSNLATVLHDLGDYQAAKVLLEKAIRSDEKNFGEDHPSTSLTYSNLASVLQDLGDYENAKLLLEKAIKSDEKNFGDDYPNTARNYSNLAMLLRDLGDIDGAKSLLEKAVKSYEKNLGEDHPSTAISYSNLASVLRELGEYSKAQSLLQKAIVSGEKIFGEAHPSIAIRYMNLAMLYYQMKDLQMALQFAEKALNIFKQVLPENHPHIKRAIETYQSIKNGIDKTTA